MFLKGMYLCRLVETKNVVNIAVVGNPNSGKTSLFNALTGMHQRVGNFPGVTVDKKTGIMDLDAHTKVELIDLPGTYALYPRRADEWVCYRVLMHVDKTVVPDMILLIADASNLRRNLLFCTQIIDLKIPVVAALTMNDIAAQRGISINIDQLSKELGIPIIPVDARNKKGLTHLKKALAETAHHLSDTKPPEFIDNIQAAPEAIGDIHKLVPGLSNYACIHYLINHENFPLDQKLQDNIEDAEQSNQFNGTKVQAKEILDRFSKINLILKSVMTIAKKPDQKMMTDRLDDILMHKVWGYIILIMVLFLLFQSVFWLASYPMDLVDYAFKQLSALLSQSLPVTWWSSMIINGAISGISAIAVFIPQILILFGLITVIEDTGYMARISFLTDKIMRKVGLNGKSVMPMMSGFACAVPAIMTTRNIENRKERLLTMLVIPLISCSARLPVYTMMLSLVVPKYRILGIFNLQGLIMMLLYVLGFGSSLIVSLILNQIIHIKEKSFFVLELPIYRSPRWRNVWMSMIEKAKIFVKGAGQIILIVSMILWFLSSFGPGNNMQKVDAKYETMLKQSSPQKQDSINRLISAEKLQHSYAGVMGQKIEPLIRPLGYDWKIGIALISSFAAREAFVGTMSTIYSVEDNSGNSLHEKMQQDTYSSGSKIYTTATAMSLIIFYVFCMQCASTLAMLKRETQSWKWPIIEFTYMTALAYLMSFITYHIFL